MAAIKKTYDEKISDVSKEIEQLENLKKRLVQEKKDRDAKERTHRLIERGAILESLIEGAVTLTNDQIKSFLAKTIQTDFARKILLQIKEPNIIEIATQLEPSQSESGEFTGENVESV